MGIWVDTDFGFDDLWALLVLRHLKLDIDGVSLVAGNAPLTQVKKNAQASIFTFDLACPVYSGCDAPLQRKPETAERILGKLGMQTRGTALPYQAAVDTPLQSTSAIDALASWLVQSGHHHILALGPLTNLATLQQQHPASIARINQITWLGGSRGRGNHSQFAEFNALADPDALALVAAMNCPLRIVELELCRSVSFCEADIPTLSGPNQLLVNDLLGGYLDIALNRGRSSMAIYDPLAALAVADKASVVFEGAGLSVQTETGDRYGQTVITTEPDNQFEFATNIDRTAALQLCMAALSDA